MALILVGLACSKLQLLSARQSLIALICQAWFCFSAAVAQVVPSSGVVSTNQHPSLLPARNFWSCSDTTTTHYRLVAAPSRRHTRRRPRLRGHHRPAHSGLLLYRHLTLVSRRDTRLHSTRRHTSPATMASTRHCTASLARLAISTPCTSRPALPTLSARHAAPAATALFSTTSSFDKAVSKKTGPTLQQQALQKERAKRKKKQSRHKEYKYATPSQEERWSLCDAMRYVYFSYLVLSTTSPIPMRPLSLNTYIYDERRLTLPP